MSDNLYYFDRKSFFLKFDFDSSAEFKSDKRCEIVFQKNFEIKSLCQILSYLQFIKLLNFLKFTRLFILKKAFRNLKIQLKKKSTDFDQPTL